MRGRGLMRGDQALVASFKDATGLAWRSVSSKLCLVFNRTSVASPIAYAKSRMLYRIRVASFQCKALGCRYKRSRYQPRGTLRTAVAIDPWRIFSWCIRITTLGNTLTVPRLAHDDTELSLCQRRSFTRSTGLYVIDFLTNGMKGVQHGRRIGLG